MVWFEKLVSRISIAPFTFRNVLAADGGPICEIKSSQIDSNKFEAYAFLKPQLVKPNFNVLYGNSDGTGTSDNLWEAQAIAISEAMERWAFNVCRDQWKNRVPYSNHSSGFAAFPGLNYLKARENALSEALERWVLAQLALGKTLGLKQFSMSEKGSLVEGVRIELSFLERVFVLLKQEFCFNGKKMNSYGFSCDFDDKRSVERAKNEMYRNQAVLKKFCLNSEIQVDDIFEQRVLYFAELENDFFKTILASLSQSSKPTSLALPDLLIDEKVVGPWTQYAKVWRCFFGLPFECLDRNEKKFFWF